MSEQNKKSTFRAFASRAKNYLHDHDQMLPSVKLRT